MNEIYTKLNYYLNEICNYLKGKDFFLLDNIKNITALNDKFNNLIHKYDLDYEVNQNHLTFLDVYNLAREIIGSIDKDYLPIYDKLINNGRLDFGYENDYEGSFLRVIWSLDNMQKFINIKREFSYRDVVTLVHEFIHYIGFDKDNKIYYYLCEFIAIYFETYAIDYLIKKGIPKEEVDYLKRFKYTKNSSNKLYNYELILLTFTKFGNLSDTSYALFQKFYMDMKKEDFEKECKNFYKNLESIIEEHKFELQDNPKSLGEILSNENIDSNYRYVLGTILAFYVFEYGDIKDMVYLNNHLEKFKDKSIMEACASIGIDLDDPEFTNKAMTAIDKYLSSLGVSKTR